MKFGQWLGLISLAISLFILWQIRQLVLLLFVAVVMAIALNRLVRLFQRRLGVQRGAATLMAVGGFLGILVLFGILIVPPFVQQLRVLTQLVPEGIDRLQLWIEQSLAQLPSGAEDYLPNFNTDLLGQLQPIATSLFNNFFDLFTGFFTVTLGVLLIIVLTTMLLLNPTPYRQGFIRFFPSFYRRRVDEILTLCENDLVGWIIGTLINMVVIGFTSGVVLLVLQVKLVLANALLAGLFEAIPNVGPVLSTVAPTTIALLDSPWKAIAVLVAYILLQQAEQFLLVPLVMGQQVSLLPAVTLLAQVFFASFFGFLGLFLAIPLVIIVRVLLREIVVKDVLDHWHSRLAYGDALPPTDNGGAAALPGNGDAPPDNGGTSPHPPNGNGNGNGNGDAPSPPSNH